MPRRPEKSYTDPLEITGFTITVSRLMTHEVDIVEEVLDHDIYEYRRESEETYKMDFLTTEVQSLNCCYASFEMEPMTLIYPV